MTRNMTNDPFIGRVVDQDIINDDAPASGMDHIITMITRVVATSLKPPIATNLDPPIHPQPPPSFVIDVPSHKWKYDETMPPHVS